MATATAAAQLPAARSTPSPPQLVEDAHVARALGSLEKNLPWMHEQHIRINEIAAPPFLERSRGAYLRRLLEGTGLKVRTDEIGNVIGERAGTDSRNVILVSAHLDTVYPPGTDVRVRQDGSRLVGPGITDNGNGLAALVAVARALHEAKLRTRLTLVLVANVGEEGEGNLRGMRKLVESYRGRLRAVIAIDGASTEHITSMALASRRLEVAVTGPGGHSWSDFGMSNPIHALSRGVARFVKVRVPDDPRTTFNVGTIEGGTSVNSIPYRAAIKVDLRSESEPEIDRLEAALREAIQAGVEEEMEAGRNKNSRLETRFRIVGARPGGELPADSPLLAAVRAADRYLGIRARLERSSTDANIPLSQGIPAISVGGGGNGGAAHSLREWYDPADRIVGLKRILLTLLAVAGHEPESVSRRAKP